MKHCSFKNFFGCGGPDLIPATFGLSLKGLLRFPKVCRLCLRPSTAAPTLARFICHRQRSQALPNEQAHRSHNPDLLSIHNFGQKKKSHLNATFLVAGAGFEPHDLRVMSPTSYQTAPPCDIYFFWKVHKWCRRPESNRYEV